MFITLSAIFTTSYTKTTYMFPITLDQKKLQFSFDLTHIVSSRNYKRLFRLRAYLFLFPLFF